VARGDAGSGRPRSDRVTCCRDVDAFAFELKVHSERNGRERIIWLIRVIERVRVLDMFQQGVHTEMAFPAALVVFCQFSVGPQRLHRHEL
jgi:hypothetical protein